MTTDCLVLLLRHEERKCCAKYVELFTPFHFFSIDILLRIHLNKIKTLLPGTNILRVPGKNIKRNQ